VVCIVLGLRRSRDGLGFVGARYGRYVEGACGIGTGLGVVPSKVSCSPLPSNRGVRLGPGTGVVAQAERIIIAATKQDSDIGRRMAGQIIDGSRVAFPCGSDGRSREDG
jgi:hypothetical protein